MPAISRHSITIKNTSHAELPLEGRQKKSHSALPENTFVCKELDFDINIVEAMVGYSITSGIVA